MMTTLAIYEALIQANVPPAAARRAAEVLEAGMTQHLATKEDLARLDARFAAAETQLDLKLQNLESRIVVKLGALMTFLLAVTGTVLALVG